MKNLSKLSFILLLLLTSKQALASNFHEVEGKLIPGQCAADPESKVYVSNLVKNPETFKNHPVMKQYQTQKAEAVDTADTNFYYCRLSCAEADQNNSVRLQGVWMLHQDSTSRFASMEGFLCVGVSIEQVNIVGSIYSPMPVSHPLWAFEARSSELREWLKQSEFVLSASEYQEQKNKMQTDLKTIGMAYVTSTSAELQAAGVVLLEIANDSEFGRAALAEKLSELIQNNWKFKRELTADSFVYMAIEQTGRFLEFYPNWKSMELENEIVF